MTLASALAYAKDEVALRSILLVFLTTAVNAHAFVQPVFNEGSIAISTGDPGAGNNGFETIPGNGPFDIQVGSDGFSVVKLQVDFPSTPNTSEITGSLVATAIALSGTDEFSEASFLHEFVLSQPAHYSLTRQEHSGSAEISLTSGSTSFFDGQGELPAGTYNFSAVIAYL